MTTLTCSICGRLVASEPQPGGQWGKRAQHAERDMQAHLFQTHSFAEVLRHEIREDLDQVPDEQRPAIVRDIYRNLLGTTRAGSFALDAADSQSTYSIDEVLGSVDWYRLWRSANSCGDVACSGHGSSTDA